MANSTTYKFVLEVAGRVGASFERAVNKSSGNLGKLQKTVQSLKKVAAAGFAVKAAVDFGTECAKAAMEFENAMSDVAKVVDGLKDNAGRTTKAYDEMAQSIINLSKHIPMTAEEISQIVASAGQAGIASNELIGFAESAAKMGIAFDTTAEQAGDWMAQWRTALKLTQPQVESLADQINYLGNTSSEKATKLAEIVGRVGSLGQIAGLSGGQVAALGAATTGIEANVAATGLKKLITTMTAGTSATDKQAAVLKKLGFSATDMAERMQKDAQGAIIDLLGAINKLPKAEQTAAIKDYFGQESLSTIAVLANNLDNLQDQFNKVGDATKYTGSMQAEYEARAATTENSIILMKNAFQALKIQIGNYILPIIGKLATIGAKGINGLSNGIKILEPYVSRIAAKIRSALAPAMEKLKPLGASFVSLFQKAAPVLRVLGNIALGVAKVFAGAFFQKIQGALVNVVSTISSLIQSATQIFGGICDFLTGVFAGNWQQALEGIVGIFSGIWNGLVAIAKAPLNGIITMINTVIGGLNSLSFTVPDWVPIAGGKGFDVNIPTIPMLANGGIVSNPTLAMVGEGSEPEAVTPLSKLSQMLRSGGAGPGSGIVFSPTLIFQGPASQEDVESAMKMTFEEFKKMMRQYELENKRRKFA